MSENWTSGSKVMASGNLGRLRFKRSYAYTYYAYYAHMHYYVHTGMHMHRPTAYA